MNAADVKRILPAREAVARGLEAGIYALQDRIRDADRRLAAMLAHPGPWPLEVGGEDLHALMIMRGCTQIVVERQPALGTFEELKVYRSALRRLRGLVRSLTPDLSAPPPPRRKCPLGVLAKNPEAIPGA